MGSCICYCNLFLTQNKAGRQNFFFFSLSDRNVNKRIKISFEKLRLCFVHDKKKIVCNVQVKYLLEGILLSLTQRDLEAERPLKAITF